MKRFSLSLFLLISVLLGACQKENSELDPTVESADFESVTDAAARYAASTDSVTLGKCKGKLTEVAVEDLAASITDYISTTYPGSEIEYAAKDESGKVIVAITLSDGTAKGLLFNADGTFKEELKGHGHKAKLTKIEISALPVTVTDYITLNYAGAEIKMAGTNEAGGYFVGIIVDDKVQVLLFNADGSFNKVLDKPAKRRKKH